jgi:hypothetical protein
MSKKTNWPKDITVGKTVAYQAFKIIVEQYPEFLEEQPKTKAGWVGRGRKKVTDQEILVALRPIKIWTWPNQYDIAERLGIKRQSLAERLEKMINKGEVVKMDGRYHPAKAISRYLKGKGE